MWFVYYLLWLRAAEMNFEDNSSLLNEHVGGNEH
jgi:hypothetical protein